MILHENCLDEPYSSFHDLVLIFVPFGAVGLHEYLLLAVDGNSLIVCRSIFLSCILHVEDDDCIVCVITVKFLLFRDVQSLMHY